MSSEPQNCNEIAARIVRHVRDGLDAAGHHAITIEQSWVKLETLHDGESVLMVDVPVGQGVTLPLKAMSDCNKQSLEQLVSEFAGDLVLALPNVVGARRSLVRYRRAIGKAVGSTAPRMIWDVKLKPLFARHLANVSSRDVVKHVVAVTHVSGLDADLQTKMRQVVVVETPDDVAGALGPLQAVQHERWRQWSLVHAPGPRFTIDGVTVALLSSFGFDPVEVLRRFQEVPHFTLMVEWQSEIRHFALTTNRLSCLSPFHPLVELPATGQMVLPFDTTAERRVESTIALGTHMSWASNYICVERPKHSKRSAPAAKPGQAADNVINHPAFRDRLVTMVEPFSIFGDGRIFIDAPRYRFDATSGTFSIADDIPFERLPPGRALT